MARDGMLVLRVVKRLHVCEGSGLTKRSSASQKSFIDEAVSGHLQVVQTTKVTNIQDAMSIHFAKKVSYKVAHMCLQRLQTGGLGHQRYSFQLLPAYRDQVELHCPGALVDLLVDPTTGK